MERVVASPTFRSSPQLAAFLRFIVESALAGNTEDIKGYTIAIKALGRSEDFNPKTDAIVRVEAGRLRRALTTYYSEAGATDPIGIELPARGYVPAFQRRNVVPPSVAAADRYAQIRTVATKAAQAGRPYAEAVGLLTLGALAYWAVETWYFGDRFVANSTYVTAGVMDAPPEGHWRGRPVGPVIQVAPTQVTGAPTGATITPTSLRDRLRDTFARFDDVTIVSDTPDAATKVSANAPAPDYRFFSDIEYNTDATITLSFRLVDTSDGAIVWSRDYDHLKIGADSRQIKYPIVRELAATLFNPYGVVKARDRSKIAGARISDPRYRCVLESGDYWRGFDLTMQAPVRDCLEQAVAQDPTFAGGYALLARVYLREYQFAASGQGSDALLLDRALDMAKRAIELRPNSARSYYVLLDVQMTRGAVDEAVAAGETAIKLNPDDPVVCVHYALQLIGLGSIEKGEALLEQVPNVGPVNQTNADFARFLAAYLKDDVTSAAAHANRISSNTYSLGHLARTLVAHKRGDKTSARQAYDRLVEVAPTWRANARGELRKWFGSPDVVERLAADLNEASAVAVN